jgi:sarcosine oxidase
MSGGYDAIVVGLGGMGSAAAYHLARRGRRVLGLDAFPAGHKQGASHGQTRIIREAYAEAPDYVPIVQRAYALWRELEAESGEALLRITGGLTIGPAGNASVTGVIASAERFGLPYELLGPGEVAARFPGFRLTDDLVAVHQPNSGFLRPEACTAAHLALAARHGADLRHAEPARRWTADGAGVVVETNAGVYRADRLVITAGPWAGQVLRDLGLPLTVTRMYNVHFEPSNPDRFAPDRCPIYGWKLPEGEYYGLPALPDQGVKFGRHDGGEVCTPETARREVTEAEVEALRAVLDRHMPGAAGRVLWTLTCLYTLTPDHHFILDRHPAHPNVAYGCGFSGHGFKFAAVIGEIMADLALEGSTRHPIGFLGAARFEGRGARG